MLSALLDYKNLAIKVLVLALVAATGFFALKTMQVSAQLETAETRIEFQAMRLAAQAATLENLKAAATRTDVAVKAAQALAQRATAMGQVRADALQTASVPPDCAGAIGWAAEHGKTAGAW